MKHLYQFGLDDNLTFQHGYESIPEIKITGAPSDVDFSRWSATYDGERYLLYCFKGTTRDIIYPFSWNGDSYGYMHNLAYSQLRFANMPDDVDPSTFQCLYDG